MVMPALLGAVAPHEHGELRVLHPLRVEAQHVLEAHSSGPSRGRPSRTRCSAKRDCRSELCRGTALMRPSRLLSEVLLTRN